MFAVSQLVCKCNLCNALGCLSLDQGGGKNKCIVWNARLPIPDKLSAGQQQYVKLSREYVKLVPTADMTKIHVNQMRGKVRAANKLKETPAADKKTPGDKPAGQSTPVIQTMSPD